MDPVHSRAQQTFIRSFLTPHPTRTPVAVARGRGRTITFIMCRRGRRDTSFSSGATTVCPGHNAPLSDDRPIPPLKLIPSLKITRGGALRRAKPRPLVRRVFGFHLT